MNKSNSYLQPWLIAAFLSSSLLIGCGGGGSGNSNDAKSPSPAPTTTNQPPMVTISGDNTIAEQQHLSLSANATDADGTIASIHWSVVTGEGITLNGADSENVNFTAPDIDTNTIITLQVLVTDNDGATATQSISITITPVIANQLLTITGLVTDNIIRNADIQATVGSEVFTATADDNGEYHITLSVGEPLLGELVQLRALGDSNINPEVEFISQLGSFASLIEQAGSNNALTKENNFGVNITNVTTAEYALITRNGATPTSDEALSTAVSTLNNDEKYMLAALIKIVVDNNDYNLPNGIISTLDLVSDVTMANAFYQTVTTQNPTLVKETIRAIVHDNNLSGETSIVGTWRLGNDVITFARSGHYVHITTKSNADGCEQIGYEVGTYSWNKASRSLSFTTKEDSNGCSGLFDENSGQLINTLIVHGSRFSVINGLLTIDENGEIFTASRLTSTTNPFVGGYYTRQTNFSDDLSMLITIDDNKSVFLRKINSGDLPAGISYLYIMRDYSYDAESSLRIVNAQKVYVNGNIVGEVASEIWRALTNAQGDVISMTSTNGTSFIRNSHTTTSQDYLTNDRLSNAGGNFSGMISSNGDNSEINFNVSFNKDGTGQGSSAQGSSSFKWEIILGQLLITQNSGETEIWSPINLTGETWQFTVIQYGNDGTFSGSSAGSLQINMAN